jgi:O-antigen ligase
MTFSPLFSTVNPWFTQIRYGFGRVSGPFGHAIFMGTIVAIAIMLHRYIAHFGLWERQFRWLRHLPMRKQSILLFGLIVGILMTISRGPWLSAVIGVLIGSIGLAHNWRREFVKVAVTLIVGGGLVYLGGQAYFADAKLSATKEQVASAEYRTKLVDEYAQIAQERKLTGWGSVSWPQVQGMASIDNWYLLLTIMHGFTGLGAFVLMLILPIVQLFWSGMQNDQLAVDQRALIFTLVGIILAIGVSVITVYLGGQLYPLLFLFIGWSDACVIYQPKRVSTALMFAFRKVYA